MRYFANAQTGIYLTELETGYPSGSENTDWWETTVPPDYEAISDYKWDNVNQVWIYDPYIAPYEPKCLIWAVNPDGTRKLDEGDLEIVIVVNPDNTHSVKVRKVTKDSNWNWTAGPFL